MLRSRANGPTFSHPTTGRGIAWVVGIALGLLAPMPGAQARPGDDTEKSDKEKSDKDKDDGRSWIKHRVIQKETLDSIAARYGVTRQAIVRWNKKKLGKREWIFAGQRLSIWAHDPVPPPREKVTYEVKRGDTWPKIAAKFDVPVGHLRAWNPKVPKSFIAGTDLVVWTNPKAPPPDEELPLGEGGVDEGGDPLPTVLVKAGGLSVGKPNRGKLRNGVQLPDNDMIVVRDPEKAWGSTHAIEQLLLAVAKFREASGYTDKLVLGAVSLKGGGRFRPHKSHQSGRDFDLRMPKKSGRKKVESINDIDWGATWELIKALHDTGEVEYIFMSWSRQRALHKAARARGATSSELATLIQYPRKPKTGKGLVRHSQGHDKHIHIRFTCAKGNERCESY